MSNINDQVFFVGQKAFIQNSEGKLLVLKDPLAGLDFPGGKVQANEEDLKLSLQREVREETGLEIEVGDAFYTWRFHYPLNKVAIEQRDTRTDGNIYRVGFACHLVSGEIKLSVEHAEYKWITKDDLQKVESWGGDLDALQKFFSRFSK